MKFLADENIEREIVNCLREEGHVVFYVAEMEPGISDEAVLNLANKEKAILMTSDKDFGELVFRLNRIHQGVVLVRLAGLYPEEKEGIILGVIKEHKDELLSAFTVISPNSVRIRKKK
ncbi:MAG: DUF5615 family PIN-like protein [Deltaproteobacteria bacterium]|nr:DUF5615 family PIN-like protein [Deltaproteobacteria bacterium]